jgi:hypothetical protein
MPLVGLVAGSNVLFLSHLLVLTTFFLSLHFHAGAVTVRAGDRAHRPKGARQTALLHVACEAVFCCRFTDNRCVFASDSVVVVIVVIVVIVVAVVIVIFFVVVVVGVSAAASFAGFRCSDASSVLDRSSL